MRFLLAFALLVGVMGCDSSSDTSAGKATAAPKVTTGKQATGVGLQEAGH